MEGVSARSLKIFTGSAHPGFAAEVCRYLGVELGRGRVFRFSDGEVGFSVEESVRGADVYVIQPTCPPVNENLMELLIMVDALRRASAYRVNVVTPYFGYARQDRKTKARDPITAKLVANLITIAGARRLVVADLHAGQIQGFFDIPVDHLTGVPLLAKHFLESLPESDRANLVAVSPDVGGVARARYFADLTGADLAIVHKRRVYEAINTSAALEVIGNVRGKVAVVVDDIIDTAGTMLNAARLLLERGAREVHVCATHGILSGPALERLYDDSIKSVVLTDTVPAKDGSALPKMKYLSITRLFAEAIRRIHSDHSVSVLFGNHG